MTFPSAPVTVNGSPMGRHPCETSRSTWAPANLAPTAPLSRTRSSTNSRAPALLLSSARHAPNYLGTRHIGIDVLQQVVGREAEGVTDQHVQTATRSKVVAREDPSARLLAVLHREVSTGPVPSTSHNRDSGVCFGLRAPRR